MKFKKSLIPLAVPVLLFSQGIAHASVTNGRAVEACAAAITEYFEGRQGVAPGLQLDKSKLDAHGRLYSVTSFELDAYDPGMESVVGRFTCIVSERGKVRRLITLPLTAPDALERGRG